MTISRILAKKKRRTSAGIAAALLFGLGCGGSNTGARYARSAEQAQESARNPDDRTAAPEGFAIGDREVELAKKAADDGDDEAAELHSERATAAYRRASILARLVRATQEADDAKTALARATTDKERFAADRQALDREADDLEKRLRVAREAELPKASGPADPAREKARAVAARTLTTQAKLLCGAAKLVAPGIAGLGDAESAVSAVERDAAKAGSKAPIDAAGRARAGCLAVLTKARRSTITSDEQADALLAELSQAGGAPANADAKGEGPLPPLRDERGVVVTLSRPFDGEKLARAAEAAVKDLGRVAAAHPAFAVQVVVHTAKGAASTVDEKRGETLARALVEGGADAKRIGVEQAGNGAPLVDPGDATRNARNERVEIVFVAPGAAK